jgi:hypothetical protein
LVFSSLRHRWSYTFWCSLPADIDDHIPFGVLFPQTWKGNIVDTSLILVTHNTYFLYLNNLHCCDICYYTKHYFWNKQLHLTKPWPPCWDSWIWSNDWRSEVFDQMTENCSHLAKWLVWQIDCNIYIYIWNILRNNDSFLFFETSRSLSSIMHWWHIIHPSFI